MMGGWADVRVDGQTDRTRRWEDGLMGWDDGRTPRQKAGRLQRCKAKGTGSPEDGRRSSGQPPQDPPVPPRSPAPLRMLAMGAMGLHASRSGW